MQQGAKKAAVISYQTKYERPSHAGEGRRGHAKRKGGYRPWRV